MKTLIIEASTKQLSLALFDHEKCLQTFEKEASSFVSQLLIPEIQNILKKNHITIHDLDVIGVGLGPGSFTGLRVALAAAKGFVFEQDIYLIGVPSCEALVHQFAGAEEEDVFVLSDARREQIYFAHYTKSRQGFKMKKPIGLVKIEELKQYLPKGAFCIGDGVALIPKAIISKNKYKVMLQASKPLAKYLWPSIKEKIKNKKWSNPSTIVPLYVYPDHCQVRR